MTKKKTSRQKQKDPSMVDTSEEEYREINSQGRVCSHVLKGLNFARVKRSLKASNVLTCNGCNNSTEVENEDSPEIWICLQCGNCGCGRMSTDKHALQHFKTIHSDCHALVLSCSSEVVWCYECDSQVNLLQSRNLKQCVEFLMKSKGNKANSNIKKSSSSGQESLLETVLREQTAVKSGPSKAADLKNSNKIKIEPISSKLFAKGLRNLGNTCFFNAVMQSLSQTHLLHKVLEKACTNDYIWEIPQLELIDDKIVENNNENLRIAIPRQFPLAVNLLNFYKQITTSTSVKTEIINPSPLFSEISKKCPQFKHFQEQDSHELLRQLLDGIRQDEVKRQKKAILRHFDVATLPAEEVGDDTKKLIKAYSCHASHTMIEKIFGGTFISTVLCEECKTSSQVFEPFMDISLPLFEEKQLDNCDQLYLDGGQQQDFKPLRYRKADVEDNKEFVLNKPKREVGKPSKYQERKMKQLARKEKKKKFNRSKKLGESNEETGQVVEEEELPKEEFIEAQNDVKEINSSIEVDEKEDTAEVDSINHSQVLDTEHEELQDKSKRSLKNESAFEVNENGKRIDKETDVNSEALPSNKPGEHQASEDVSVETEKKDSLLNSLKDVNSSSGLKNKDKLYQEITTDIPSDIKTNHIPYENCNGGMVQSDDDILEPSSKTKASLSESDSEEQGTETLTEKLNAMHISNTESPDLNDRMEVLRLQVKEVRIRKDSDQCGSMLDTSLSPCEDANNAASCESHEDTCDNESESNWSHALSENQTKEWILKSLLTVKPRVHVSPNECSVHSCLTFFTKPELLTGSNKFRCEKCTEMKIAKTGNKKDVAYSNASKQLLIFSPPAILTLHLKRFQQVGMSLRKVNRFVEFPPRLDLAPYCSSACLILPHLASVKEEILYSLYGVVEHSGRMSSGHYTAYVKVTKKIVNQNFMCHLPIAQCDLEQLLQKFSQINSEKPDSEKEADSLDEHKWYYISDAHVREVDIAQVLKCQAYLLFYERIK